MIQESRINKKAVIEPVMTLLQELTSRTLLRGGTLEEILRRGQQQIIEKVELMKTRIIELCNTSRTDTQTHINSFIPRLQEILRKIQSLKDIYKQNLKRIEENKILLERWSISLS